MLAPNPTNPSIQLRVDSAYPGDQGGGKARLDSKTMKALNISPGDLVAIEGKNWTVAKVWKLLIEDVDQGKTRIDNFTRINAGVTIGDTVTVTKIVDEIEANRVVLAPPEDLPKNIPIKNNPQVVNGLIDFPVTKNDSIPINLGLPFIQPQLVPFKVIEVEPEDAVIITKNTDIQFLDKIPAGLKKTYPNFQSSSQNKQTRLLYDAPVSLDQLGRKAFAEDLAIRFSRLWREIGNEESGHSFVVHLYSPWGSGKTTFLNLIQEKFEPEPEKFSFLNFAKKIFKKQKGSLEESDGRLSWNVIRFDAWRNQHVNPPWWPLFDTIYRQSVKKKNIFSRKWIGFLEFSWRLITESTFYSIIAFLLCYMGFIYLISWMIHSNTSSNTLNQVQIISAVLTIIGMVWSGTRTLTSSLISGSADSAQTFIKISQDPIENVRKHFREFVDRIDSPMIIFIDDLDRCKPEYVVQLLESIQTIFNDPKVFYIVAADRRWLNASFQKEYEHLSGEINEPGRKMCHLFLEKIFQLSITLPPIPKELLSNYWKLLLNSADPVENPELSQKNATDSSIKKYNPPEKVINKMWEDFNRKQEVVLSLAKQEIEYDTIHFLQRFDQLLEPNPRWMKRVVMAYSIFRDQLLLSGITELKSGTTELDEWLSYQLALWTIIQLRWPCLGDYLEAHPEHIDIFLDPNEKEVKKIKNKEMQQFAKEKIASFVLEGIEGFALTEYGIRVSSGLEIYDSSRILTS